MTHPWWPVLQQGGLQQQRRCKAGEKGCPEPQDQPLLTPLLGILWAASTRAREGCSPPSAEAGPRGRQRKGAKGLPEELRGAVECSGPTSHILVKAALTPPARHTVLIAWVLQSPLGLRHYARKSGPVLIMAVLVESGPLCPGLLLAL